MQRPEPMGEWPEGKLLLRKANIKAPLGIARRHVTKSESIWEKILSRLV